MLQQSNHNCKQEQLLPLPLRVPERSVVLPIVSALPGNRFGSETDLSSSDESMAFFIVALLHVWNLRFFWYFRLRRAHR